MFNRKKLPIESDFSRSTEFYIYDWDIPLTKETNNDGIGVQYFNWLDGTKKPFPIESLKIDNNWPAESFNQWVSNINGN